MSAVLSAQTQQGVVKTRGRLGANGAVIAGSRLAGASVVLKGGNAVVSGNNGNFSLLVPSGIFYLQNVQKQGYVLTDPDVLSRQYACSRNPLLLVMEVPDLQASDKLDAERKIRRTLQKQLTQKEDELEALKEQHKVSEEQYRQQLQAIYSQQESNERLISEMAERYATIDFDQMDEFNRRISQLILDGQLTEADSLLNTKGDINSRADQLRQHQQANAQAERELTQKQKKLERSKALTRQEMEDLAQDCYSKFEIFKMQHQNDSAIHYIELRASLDTTNVQWLIDVGEYIHEFLADYNRALSCYEKALQIATAQKGEYSYQTADCLNDIAVVYIRQAKFEESLKTSQKVLDIRQRVLGEMHPRTALAYSNVGGCYQEKGDYAKAIEYRKHALDIYLQVFGENHADVAREIGQLGLSYDTKGDYQHALEYYQRALRIYNGLPKSEQLGIALVKSNMVYMYYAQGNYAKGLECAQQALGLYEETYGKDHPLTAIAYNNLATLYYSSGNAEIALDYFLHALTVAKKVNGEKHPNVAINYSNLAVLYSNMEKHQEALDMLQQSIAILQGYYGPLDMNLTAPYINLANVYETLNQYDKALECYNKSLAIFKHNKIEDNNLQLANLYSGMGRTYRLTDNLAKAEECYEKAIKVISSLGNEKHPDLAMVYVNMVRLRGQQQRYLEAVDYLEKAFAINAEQKLDMDTYKRIAGFMAQWVEKAEQAGYPQQLQLKERFEKAKATYPQFFQD